MKKLDRGILLPLFLFINLLLYSDLFLDPTQPIKTFFLSIFCLVTNLFYLINKTRITHLFRNPLVLLSLLFFLWNIVSIGVSGNMQVAYNVMVKLFLGVNLLIILLIQLNNDLERQLKYFSVLASTSQLIICACILTSMLITDLFHFQGESKPYGGLFVNPNLSAQILILLIPLSSYSVLYQQRERQKLIALISISISLVFLIVLGSKTVILSGILLFITLLFLKIKSKLKPYLIYLLIVFTSLSMALVMYYQWPDLESMHSFQERKELWQRSLRMINSEPIFGYGSGSWAIENLNHLGKEKDNFDNTSKLYLNTVGNIFYLRPHNDYLWVASENGIPGLLFYLSIFIYAFYSIITIGSSTKFKQLKLLALSGILLYLFIGLFSFPKERIEQIILLSIYLALAVSVKGKLNPLKTVNTHSVFHILFLIGTIISTIICTFNLSSDFHLKNSLEAKSNQSWDICQRQALKAQNTFNKYSSDGSPIIYYQALAEFNLGLIDQSFASYKKAKDLHPNHLFILNDLGTIYASKSKIDSAINLYSRALNINPLYEDAKLNLISIYFNLNRFDESWDLLYQIPYNSTHPKFKNIVNVISEQRFRQDILDTAKEFGQLDYTLKQMNLYPFYYYKLYTKARENDSSFMEYFNSTISTL